MFENATLPLLCFSEAEEVPQLVMPLSPSTFFFPPSGAVNCCLLMLACGGLVESVLLGLGAGARGLGGAGTRPEA